MATAFHDPEGWEFPAGEICKLRFQDKKAELTAASDEAAKTVSDFDKLQSSESDKLCMEIAQVYLEDSNSPASKDPEDRFLLKLAKLLYILKNSCDYDKIIKLVSPEKAISHSDMVISVFKMLELIHLYKLETAPGPNVAHVAAPAQNKLELNDKQLRKSIRRAEEEVTQVKSSEDGECAERLEKVLNEYITRITYLASVNDKASFGQLFWTARKLYVLRQLYDHGQLEIRLKGFNASPKVQEIIERMDLLIEKNASMFDAGSSSVLGELHKENHDINEASKMRQAQTRMTYELRQQEIESYIGCGRMELLTSPSMHDSVVVEEETPPQPPILGSKMMGQDRQAKKDNQENKYDLVQIEGGNSEASKLYKGPATRWCRIERIEILEGDRQVPILPAPALLGNNANANIEFKIHGDPVATCMKLLVWVQEACDPSAADETTPGFRKFHTSSLQFWPAGCHGNPKSGLENFKFDVLEVQRSTPNAQNESSDEHFKPFVSTDMTRFGITVRPDGIVEELNFNDRSQHESEDREYPEIIITFDTHGGIGHQLDIGYGKFGSSLANLTSESQAVLAACRVLEIEGQPFKARVTLRIPHGLDDKQDVQTVNALKRLRDQKHPFPWSAYCSKTKNPLTQYGMFATRKHIVDAYGGIVKVDAQHTFNSIQEWQIMQTNAAHLDYRLEEQKIQKVNQGSHQISFYKVAGETVLAGVQLQGNGLSDQYRIAPGSPVTLSWTQPADRRKGMFRCNGTVMENVFGIPGRQMIVALDPVRPKEKIFLRCSTSINDLDRPRYSVRVAIKINTASIKHRVGAINKISGPEMQRFHAAIIAQKTSSHDPIDPVKEASGRQVFGRKVYEDVLNDSLFAWNEDQKNCFYMARALPGGIAINEGVPGSGKSRLICGLTKMFSALKNKSGVNSVCTLIEVPTNAAGDAIYSAFTHFSTLRDAEASCIRVYTQTNENRAFLKRGQPSTSSAEEEAASDTISATLIQAIATLRKNHKSSRYRLEEDSLEAHVIRLAENAANNEGNTCTRFVQSRVLRNISDSLVDPLPYLDKLPTNPNELFQVDLYPMILSYIKRMQAADINEWEDKSHIRLAKVVFGWVMEDVLAYTQVVIATPYCCGGDTLAKSFGEKFDHIMIIEDETMRQTEIDTLLPLGKLRHREKILGLILCGDTKQPRPFAISTADGDERVNEFGHQLTYPLGRRLIDACHPQTAQWEQNRMLPILAEFPNKYTYVGMTNSPVACAQVVNANWDSMMTCILGRRQEHNNYVVLSIHGSKSFTTPGHTSRQNPVHAEYIVYLVLQNHKANGYKPSEVLVIAYYTEQVRLIGELFLKVVKKGLIALNQIPAIMTTAQSQGHQAQWVLGDVVVHKAKTKSDLGFVGTQESLFNVFLTRAKTAFTGFVHRDIGSGQVARKDKLKREIVAFVQDAHKRSAIIDITQRPQEVAFLGVQTLAEIKATVATLNQADNNSWDQEQGQVGKGQPVVQEDIVGGDGTDWGIGGTAEGGADWGIGDTAEDGTDRNGGIGGDWNTAAY